MPLPCWFNLTSLSLSWIVLLCHRLTLTLCSKSSGSFSFSGSFSRHLCLGLFSLLCHLSLYHCPSKTASFPPVLLSSLPFLPLLWELGMACSGAPLWFVTLSVVTPDTQEIGKIPWSKSITNQSLHHYHSKAPRSVCNPKVLGTRSPFLPNLWFKPHPKETVWKAAS